jgi:hypothetical protein
VQKIPKKRKSNRKHKQTLHQSEVPQCLDQSGDFGGSVALMEEVVWSEFDTSNIQTNQRTKKAKTSTTGRKSRARSSE